jgi:hypothetical protein
MTLAPAEAEDFAAKLAKGDEWLAKAVARHVAKTGRCDAAALEEQVRFVLDWKAGLAARDPGFARRMRVDFSGALEHSRRWHESLARRAGKQDRAIPDDPLNAPTAIAFADGYRWVWLKTWEARSREGEAMGHCVGGGAYERLPPIRGVFSLRDPGGVPRVTILLERCDIRLEVSRANSPVPARYAEYVAEVAGVVGARLLLGRDPATPLPDGPVAFASYGHSGTAWIDGGRLHRANGPALVYRGPRRSWLRDLASGFPRSREWWVAGRRHKADGPAIVLANGDRQWWTGGRRHRGDGAAIERANGDMQWWVEGRLHRDGAPATVLTNGDRLWYRDGRLHRDDGGPAIEQNDGHSEWCREGKRHRTDGPALVRANGDREWWEGGRRHRIDGPAVDNVDGRQEWWQNRRRHNSDGPSIVYKNGDTEWHRFGLLHREDGPAIDRLGTRTWFLKGLRHRDDGGPAVENASGSREWWREGRRHRSGGPAVQFPDGSCEWWREGVRHRLGGPAVINVDGTGSWWVDGRRIRPDDYAPAEA